MALFILSFLLNTLITLPLALAIWRDHPGVGEVYGKDAPARRILGCVYLAIGLVSFYALLMAVFGQTEIARAIGFTLFPVQIIYKILTAVALRVTHPVVIANLCISGLLGLTLLLG